MTLYLNRYGFVSAFVKFVKIVLWVAASGAVAALVAKLNELTIHPDQIYAVAAVGLANGALASLTKYLATEKPDFSLPSFGKKKDASPAVEADPLVEGQA